MERDHLKLLGAGLVVGVAAGFLLARGVYRGNASVRGPVLMGPAAGEEADSAPAASAPASAPMASGEKMKLGPAEQKMHDEITALIDRARSDPKDREARVRLGNITFDNGMLEMAAKFYEEAIALDQGDARVLTDCAIAYRTLGDSTRAAAYLERAVAVDPRMVKGWYDVAVVRFFDQKDAAGAKVAIGKVLELDASFPRAKELAARIEGGA